MKFKLIFQILPHTVLSRALPTCLPPSHVCLVLELWAVCTRSTQPITDLHLRPLFHGLIWRSGWLLYGTENLCVSSRPHNHVSYHPEPNTLLLSLLSLIMRTFQANSFIHTPYILITGNKINLDMVYNCKFVND